MDYPTPLLNALQDGCVLDCRVRLAAQLLMTGRVFEYVDHPEKSRLSGPEPHTAAGIATLALDVAAQLYAQAEQRGWIEPLPLFNDLPPTEQAHVERQAAAQVFAQLHGQRVGQAEQSRVLAPVRLNGVN